MQVTNFKIQRNKKLTTFSADFIYQRPFSRRKHKLAYILKHWRNIKPLSAQPLERLLICKKRVWFTVPSSVADETQYHDAFFIPAFVLALKLKQNLEFDGEVSAELLTKAAAIERYYRFESPPRHFTLSKIKKNTKITHRQGTAQSFTLGVDSFYTLVESLASKTTRPQLLFVDGFDVPLRKTTFLKRIHTHIRDVSTATHCPVVFMQSNLRELSEPIMNWGQFHGAALAAISSLLPFQKMNLNGESFDWPDWGLRFGVDALFSTSTTQFKLVGHNLTRDLKVKRIKRSPWLEIFLQHVRVCWKNVDRNRHIQYNCSRCQKCLRTLLTLHTLDITNTPTFDSLDLRALQKIDMVGHVRQEWTILYSLLTKKSPKNRPLLSVLEEVLQKPIRS